MIDLSRRSALGSILSAAVLALALPRRAKAADQPRMQAALESLRNARRELEAATADKGGHRNKAMALVNEAIDQVQKGIAFDRRH